MWGGKEIKKGIDKNEETCQNYVFCWFRKSKTQNWRCESAKNNLKNKEKQKVNRRNAKMNKKTHRK